MKQWLRNTRHGTDSIILVGPISRLGIEIQCSDHYQRQTARCQQSTRIVAYPLQTAHLYVSNIQVQVCHGQVTHSSTTLQSHLYRMNFGHQNGQRVVITIPPWYIIQNPFDVYKYLLEDRLARWILFRKAEHLRIWSSDIIIVDHPRLMIPFFFHPLDTDTTFVNALNNRMRSPMYDDLHPV